jgi:serine/threonine protein kinase
MEQLHEQNLLEDEFWEIDEDSIKKGEKLGSGEFGTVYKALWHESDVAVKVLKQSDNLALGEFVTEMNMMRKLHHPHVVQFLGGCTKTKPYFIVTELSSGGSLQEYFASKTRLPLTRELELAIDCAKGMAYLHSEGIKKPMTLHRDLKPANVMIFGNVYAHGDKARKEVSYS